MKYENAKDLLPQELLMQVQKYASGKLLYIPIGEERKSWGEMSGYRKRLQERNQMICDMYRAGKTVSELAEQFFLSLDSVKKIVYGKKGNILMFSPTLYSAVQYANAGMAEEWIERYIAGNKWEFPAISEYCVTGVVKIPLRLININETEKSGEAIMTNDEPLIVFFSEREFHTPFQRRQLLELRKLKKNAYSAFIFTGREDYSFFMEHYGKHFQIQENPG